MITPRLLIWRLVASVHVLASVNPIPRLNASFVVAHAGGSFPPGSLMAAATAPRWRGVTALPPAEMLCSSAAQILPV